jgi:dUTP pyrophosphatase
VFSSSGTISVQNHSRVIAGTAPVAFDSEGGVHLPAGCYLVTCNEIVNLPKDIMSLARSRSSLLRCGVSIHTAVWDAGYSGRSQSLMVVYNQHGFDLYKNARIIQMVFFHLSREVTEGYNGIFQGENI